MLAFPKHAPLFLASTIVAAGLVGCAASNQVVPSLADLEIGTSVAATLSPQVAAVEEGAQSETEANSLPDIPLGRPDFRATDPSAVNLASGQVQFIEFFAYWCPSCKAMAPTVHGLEQLYGDQINFVYLDRDDPATKDIRNQLGYIVQPHFFLLGPDGEILGQWRGVLDGRILQQAMLEALD